MVRLLRLGLWALVHCGGFPGAICMLQFCEQFQPNKQSNKLL